MAFPKKIIIFAMKLCRLFYMQKSVDSIKYDNLKINVFIKN